jgi:hypothetical protein
LTLKAREIGICVFREVLCKSLHLITTGLAEFFGTAVLGGIKFDETRIELMTPDQKLNLVAQKVSTVAIRRYRIRSGTQPDHLGGWFGARWQAFAEIEEALDSQIKCST